MMSDTERLCGARSGMNQRTTLVVCGDAAEGYGDSMYEGVLYCGGRIAEPGSDTLVEEPSAQELAWLAERKRAWEERTGPRWAAVAQLAASPILLTCVAVLMAGSAARLAGNTYKAFIYFRF